MFALWFRKSKVRCCSSAAVSAFGSPVHLAWAALSLDLRQWHAWKCRNVARNVPMLALRKSIKNSTCAPKISMEMMWAISKSPPLMSHGSKSGDNVQTNVGTVGIFKGMLKMKISVRISLIQFWGAKAGIWHLGYVPFSSISDGHFHHYYLLIMLFSCTNPHIVACLIFCSHI